MFVLNTELLSAIKTTALSMFCARRYGDNGGAVAYSNLLRSLEKKFFSQKEAPQEILMDTIRSAMKEYEKKFCEPVPKKVCL